MKKNSLVVFQKIREDQLEDLKKIANQYTVIEAREKFPSSFNPDSVEIVFGWNKEIGKILLSSPTSQLKWIQAISAGVDYFDLPTIQQKGIRLTNGSGIHAVPISESVFGMLLSYYRGLTQSIKQQEKKEWNATVHYDELFEKKICIVGTGHIGKKIAQLAKAFGMTTIGINRSGHAVEYFDDIFSISQLPISVATSDIIVNILPYTSETHHLYNEELFLKMKNQSVFVNVGRGASVDTKALIKALKSNQLAYAALDVVEEEPLPNDNPLWSMPNVLITPHISDLVANFNNRLMAIFVENLKAYQSNGSLPRNLVSLKQGY